MAYVICNYCQCGYDDLTDMAIHTRRHNKYKGIENQLGFLPAGHATREQIADKAKSEISNTAFVMDVRYRAAVTLLRTYFDASLSNAIDKGYWKKHPSFESFVAMINLLEAIPVEIQALLHREFGNTLGEIPPGIRYWYLPKSNARKLSFLEFEKNRGRNNG